MKYEFKKIDIDSYELVYFNEDGKEITKKFKRTIEMAKHLQGITARARIIMGNTLSSMGITKDDLIIKKDLGNGKVIYDETNYNESLKGFIEEESINSANKLIEECFNKNILDLFKDLGAEITEEQNISVETQEQITLFIQKFMTIIKGDEEKSPSRENVPEESLE